MRKSLILIILSIWQLHAFAQERCATMHMPQNANRYESEEKFEDWLIKVKHEKALLRTSEPFQSTTYQIPVVFHVIHDGNNVGFGTNISEDRILQQIEILNNDFRRLNEDASQTPAEYLDVAADAEIEFVLAKQDPEGLPTSGIVRVEGSKSSYSQSEASTLMAQSYWPRDEYLNIYITDISGGYLGYAQFPFSNLSGIATEFENYDLTDGVVLDYKWVGNNPVAGSFDRFGRTATHEIGHWLGLRHIWGDGGCGFDDFCDDTPLAGSSTSGCPDEKITCDTQDMIQNFMDYTDDVCMNLFTVCQKERMRTVLKFSPRRVKLLTSHALNDPILADLDLGIKSIAAPVQSDCNANVTPRVEIRNYGSNTINSYSISFLINGSLVETKEFNNSLSAAATSIASFSPILLDSDISNEVQFEIISVNESSDGNDLNDSKSQTIAPFTSIEPPYFEDFETNQNYFRITETGETSNWTFVNAPFESPDNQAAMAPFFNQTTNFGVKDMLLTQTLDLSGLASAQLTFQYAYASRLQEGTSDYYLDGLIVAVSTDCGAEFTRQNVIFERYGSSLETYGSSNSDYYPLNHAHWDEVTLNITRFAGQPEVQVAIIGVNGGGNNLFVDDLSISNANLLAYDLGIKSLSNEPVISCKETAYPILEVRNYGYQEIDKLNLQLTANDMVYDVVYDDLNLKSGESETLTINLNDYLQSGENYFRFNVTKLNDINDERSVNNSIDFYTLIDATEDLIPIKEDFLNQKWLTFSPDGLNQFDKITINGDPALYTNNYGSEDLVSSWLVTPSLSTDGLYEASLQFKYSYAERQGFNDNFKVLLSLDCGVSYDIELLSLNSAQLATTTSSVEWSPQVEEDWKLQYIDLSDYVNWDNLRVAFVFSNGNGNRLFLDDINFYRTKDPDIPDLDALKTMMAVYPNPAVDNFSVAFNFPQRQDVYIQLADMSGKVVYKERYNNVLNDKFVFQTPSQGGFYVLHVKGAGIEQSKRIYIKH